jgi:hypothetical protein
MAKENDDEHALLYVGAGTDMSFPFHKTNVLIDLQPVVEYV